MTEYKIRRKLDGKFAVGPFEDNYKPYWKKFVPQFTKSGRSWNNLPYALKYLKRVTEFGFDCELIEYELIDTGKRYINV